MIFFHLFVKRQPLPQEVRGALHNLTFKYLLVDWQLLLLDLFIAKYRIRALHATQIVWLVLWINYEGIVAWKNLLSSCFAHNFSWTALQRLKLLNRRLIRTLVIIFFVFVPRWLILDGLLLRLLPYLEKDLLLAHFVGVWWCISAVVELLHWGKIDVELWLALSYLNCQIFWLVSQRLRRCKLFVRFLRICKHLLVNFYVFNRLTAFNHWVTVMARNTTNLDLTESLFASRPSCLVEVVVEKVL